MTELPQTGPDGKAAPPGPIHLFVHNLRWWGGMERFGMDVSIGMRDLGREVQVHARRVDPQIAGQLGVSVRRHRVWAFPRRLRTWTFSRRIGRLVPRLDGTQIALATVPARDVLVCSGTHRGYLQRIGRRPGLFDRLQIHVEHVSYHSPRRLASVSRLCARELTELYGVPAERITVLYPPIDTSFTPASSQDERRSHRRTLGLPEDEVVILFPSTGHSRKGLDPICEALTGMSSPPTLAIAGNPPGYRRKGLRMADGRPAPIRFLGYLKDMEAAYRAADFTILGSHYEPFGLVGPESLTCGTGLIFEKGIGCLEVVDPSVVTTFSVGDRASIQKAIAASVDLVRTGRHRVEHPGRILRYDPRPTSYARALLELAEG
jgi:glycosyltransferase involved in cell wall biosynthesis